MDEKDGRMKGRKTRKEKPKERKKEQKKKTPPERLQTDRSDRGVGEIEAADWSADH